MIGKKDIEGLEFHIASDDFFATLATVLDLLRQDIEKGGYQVKHSEILQNERDRLLYLQDKFVIKKSSED